MRRGKKKQKVMFTMGNIRKFTVHGIPNKAVTAVGQQVLHYSTLLLQGQVSTAAGSVPGADTNTNRACHLSFIHPPGLCHETKQLNK